MKTHIDILLSRLRTAILLFQVKHFDRKRSYEKFKDKIQNQGYEPVNDDRQKASA